MEKEKTNVQMQLFLFMLGGVVLGSLFANVTHPGRSVETELFQNYLMERLRNPIPISEKVIFYVFIQRWRIFLFFILIGCTSIRKQVIKGGVLWIGFLIGAAFSMALLGYGIHGGILFFFISFPHGFLYLIALAILITGIYLRQRCWKIYVSFSFWWILAFVSEIWGSPRFLQWICSVFPQNIK